MRFYTGVEILIGFLCSRYGELSDTLLYSYQDNTDHDNSSSKNFPIKWTITRKRFEKCLTPGTKPEHLQVMPSEMEIIKQDFEKRSLKLGRKIEKLEEEKMQLGLDVEEIQEEKTKVDQWEKKFQDTRAQEVTLEKSLLVCQNEKAGLKIRERDYIMGEAVAQVPKVADHLQTLAVQADVLNLKYESKSDRDRELAWLLRKIKALSIRAKSYM
ncbi:hypothetical protein Goshw_021692 [Gossypium schwendimanii]|uniref:Uncharacterized protein n=1 Tax=Gossypium schwendimanii TaxID=34291 RepID=A0A7J9NDR5_GOSSC|nr:hypothetical protein [Gossypium schwendimanii]